RFEMSQSAATTATRLRHFDDDVTNFGIVTMFPFAAFTKLANACGGDFCSGVSVAVSGKASRYEWPPFKAGMLALA
ncbi:MAG: hypothetical protein NZ914_15120, partial [Gemmatales bacterium]|nr:hypothetical protein [Gemmatales bacterium]